MPEKPTNLKGYISFNMSFAQAAAGLKMNSDGGKQKYGVCVIRSIIKNQ